MTTTQLKQRLITRLNEGGRGDRGWFIITRVHLSAERLKDTCAYLWNVGASAGYNLAERDYLALATINGITGSNPGITLRRHHLLAMEQPLRLLRRVDSNQWRRVMLTEFGVELATSQNTPEVIERALRAVVFCRRPSYHGTRVKQYAEFNVRPFQTILDVMKRCGGWIDRDEYDLFVARIRNETEMQWAVRCIKDFRPIPSAERATLLLEVRQRIPTPKIYQNWRDMALHTFSLLGSSSSAVRVGECLVRTDSLVQPSRPQRPAITYITSPVTLRTRAPLRIPSPPATDELSSPPAAPVLNPGTDAELLVSKILTAAGWDVIFYTNRRGFGFDLWAKRGSAAIVVEVKSSIEALGPVVLTELEYAAAQHHRQNYVIAVVQGIAKETPSVGFIQDPVGSMPIKKKASSEYRISREAWLTAARPVTLL